MPCADANSPRPTWRPSMNRPRIATLVGLTLLAAAERPQTGRPEATS